jgi:flavin reductase (DIM6/NTAB) family NADH-FMN oxidoreductase RutF
MKTLQIKDLSPQQTQMFLQYAVAPRPIAFVSTIDEEGNVNLSPFSFFNLFSSNPPILVFSPARRVRDNTTKHTLDNVLKIKECTINIVNYDMVQQTSLSSTDYPKGVNEFVKAGFTELKSDFIRPPRVKEAPVQFECIVRDVIALAETPGAGNLVLAEVIAMHISEDVLDADGKIDQLKMDHVARLGGDWYSRVTKDSLFQVAKPLTTMGIGVDALPEKIRNSKVLTGNNLGQLGNVEYIPKLEVDELNDLNHLYGKLSENQIHLIAKEFLDNNNVVDAWKLLLSSIN